MTLRLRSRTNTCHYNRYIKPVLKELKEETSSLGDYTLTRLRMIHAAISQGKVYTKGDPCDLFDGLTEAEEDGIITPEITTIVDSIEDGWIPLYIETYDIEEFEGEWDEEEEEWIEEPVSREVCLLTLGKISKDGLPMVQDLNVNYRDGDYYTDVTLHPCRPTQLFWKYLYLQSINSPLLSSSSGV